MAYIGLCELRDRHSKRAPGPPSSQKRPHVAVPDRSSPKGPCRYMVYAWALKRLLYHDFGAHVGTIIVLGPFGFSVAVALPTAKKSPGILGGPRG